jgi:hypothetical protein
MSFLLTLLQDLFAWLGTFLLDLPLYVLSLLLAGLAALINDIPAPGFFTDAAGWISSVPPLVAYVLQTMQIGTGMVIIVTAYTTRFLIRRIPLIG